MQNIVTRGYGGRKTRATTWGYGGFLSNAVTYLLDKLQIKRKGCIKLKIKNPISISGYLNGLIEQPVSITQSYKYVVANAIRQVRLVNYTLWNACFIKNYKQFALKNSLSHNKLLRILDEL